MDEIKNEEINLVDEGFEELTPKSENTAQAAAGQSQGQTQQQPQGQNQPGSRPDFRIVQPDRDAELSAPKLTAPPVAVARLPLSSQSSNIMALPSPPKTAPPSLEARQPVILQSLSTMLEPSPM